MKIQSPDTSCGSGWEIISSGRLNLKELIALLKQKHQLHEYGQYLLLHPGQKTGQNNIAL